MIKFVTTIVDYDMREEIQKLYKLVGIKFAIFTQGKGMANSETLEILGLAENPKSLIFSLVEDNNVHELIDNLAKQFQITKNGKGIAFVIGLSGINKNSYERIAGNNIEINEKEKINMDAESNYELIITIVEEEQLDNVKNAAVSAGARGGTSIKALGLGTEEASKFLGITISPEKEIMLNVVKKEEKKRIMEAITKEIGIQEAGKGICFSVPVESAIGLA